MELLTEPLYLALFIPNVLFALSMHEASHAYSAYLLGDDTAALMGRVTLNPGKHLDLIGSVAFFIIGFGWAKPVPVNPLRLKNPRRDDLLISLAGPGSNMVIGILLLLLILMISSLVDGRNEVILGIMAFLFVGAQLNIGLCFFNLIPIPPLDGSHVLRGILPESAAEAIEPIMAQGAIILILLIVASSFMGIPVFEYLVWRPMYFIIRNILGEGVFMESLAALKLFLKP
jgi:Zn-dependent protease